MLYVFFRAAFVHVSGYLNDPRSIIEVRKTTCDAHHNLIPWNFADILLQAIPKNDGLIRKKDGVYPKNE